MKSTKKNILKPLLFIGLGLAITTIVLAKSDSRIPSEPGQPCIEDFWENGCIINYTPPRSDGGYPIICYLIECNTFFIWENKGTSRTLKYRVENMVEGSWAKFRVKAENRAGFGDPSEPSDRIIFKAR